MARLMSVSMTEQAVNERRKTVTRRKGWWVDKHGRRLLKPGDRLTLCRKVMGRKPGEPLVRLAEVEVVDVRREPLCLLLRRDYAGSFPPAPEPYATDEVAREGFPALDPAEFVQRFFIAAQGIDPLDDVTRIEWRYLAGVGPTRPWTDDLLNCTGEWCDSVTKRCCNGCGRKLGDVTDAEIQAGVDGRQLPDVRRECGCLA